MKKRTLPSQQDMNEHTSIKNKPRLVIGEFCIVLTDSRNFTTYVWGSNEVTVGRHKGKTITKFRFIGHSSSLCSALIGIQRHMDENSPTQEGRELTEAIEYLKRRQDELLKIAPDIEPKHFLKKDGVYYEKSLLEDE
jgi:hypothetical protein